MAPEESGEVVLEGAELEGAGLGSTPFFVATAGFPVGDVALGDAKAAFVERVNYFPLSQVVGQHPVDHFALELGQMSDFAIARLGWPTVLKGFDRGGHELKGKGCVRWGGTVRRALGGELRFEIFELGWDGSSFEG